MKKCKRCLVEKDEKEFRQLKRTTKGITTPTISPNCIVCCREKEKEYYMADLVNKRIKLKDKARKLAYGITREEFNKLIELQNNKCAICLVDKPTGKGDWHIDHDHITGKIRGLLCHHCNTGLGLFKDNVELLTKAQSYLDSKIKINEYQKKALETSFYPSDKGIEYTLFGLLGEVGELANKFKKTIRDKGCVVTDEDKKEMAKELGDCFWYMATLSKELGYTLENIAEINLEKLRSRQQRGTLGGSGDNR